MDSGEEFNVINSFSLVRYNHKPPPLFAYARNLLFEQIWNVPRTLSI